MYLEAQIEEDERNKELRPKIKELLQEYYKQFPNTKLLYGWFSGSKGYYEPWEHVTPNSFDVMLTVQGVSGGFDVVGAKKEQRTPIEDFLKKFNRYAYGDVYAWH